MKIIVSILVLILGRAHAQACTNFAGAYKNVDGDTLHVAQLACESVTIATQENGQGKPIVNEFLIDGRRHEIQNMFWLTYWAQQTLVREPWSSETGGMELGFRELWTLDGETLIDLKRDASDNSEISRTIYQRSSLR